MVRSNAQACGWLPVVLVSQEHALRVNWLCTAQRVLVWVVAEVKLFGTSLGWAVGECEWFVSRGCKQGPTWGLRHACTFAEPVSLFLHHVKMAVLGE